ncbi:MAG: hypothetical protein D6743_02055 [Calditrichaeota bacterium]|nr:MAG: hypothetical protein D6743_02055 [Calditrichota bacterium]
MKKLRNRLRNNERGRKNNLGVAVAGLLALLFFACSNVPDDLILDSQPTGIIFVKATRTSTLNSFSPGGNLFSLVPASPDGKLTNLTKLTDGDVADPEISFDGLKVIFAMRRTRNERFHIYEMNVDGTGLRQLTSDPERDDFDPTYLPNGKILFTSNRPGFLDEYNKRTAEVLHVMNADGSNIECISFNASDDFDPIVMADGRILYTRWEHHGPINRFPLFFTHPDGGGTFTFFSPHSMRTFFHPRQMPDGNIVAIHSGMVNGDRGPIVIIKDKTHAGEPLTDDAYVNITPEIETSGPPYEKGVFKYPHPLPDGRILVSYSPRFGEFRDANDNVIEDIEPDYGLYTINKDGSDLRLLYNDPDTHEFDAVVISARPVPPVLPSTLDRSQDSGVLTVQNVYFRQRNDGQFRPNKAIREVRQVMIIEGLPRPFGDRGAIGETSFERKRIIGVAPVQPDGSFSVRVPANIPMSFNTLDSLGRALVIKRNWVTVRPGEQFPKCTGCHGPRGQDSGNPNPIAATLPPTDLNVPEGQREDVSFGNAIEPIIAAKCVSCHTGAQPAGNLDLSLSKDINEPLFSLAYLNIFRMENFGSTPFSRKSRLVDKLLGIDEFQGAGRHPDGANALTDDEIRKFMNWIDLGAQYR